MLGQAIGAVTDATHGMTLSAVALPYYRLVMPYGVKKFARFATSVFDVPAGKKTDEQLAEAGLAAMSDWMDQIGVVRHAASSASQRRTSPPRSGPRSSWTAATTSSRPRRSRRSSARACRRGRWVRGGALSSPAPRLVVALIYILR